MSSVSFGKVADKATEAAKAVDAEVVGAADPLAGAAPANENTAVATQNHGVSTRVNEGGVSGEVDDNDISFPRVRVIQGTSKFANFAPLGSITLGFDSDLLVLAKEGQHVDFVVASIHKQFQEKVPWGSDKMPQVFDTLAEVQAAGGQINNAKGAAFYDSIAHVRMFVGIPVERRDTDPQADLIEGLFPFEQDGMLWAPAVYTASGMSYSSFAKSIFTAQRFQLKNLYDGIFHMRSSEVPTNFGPKKKLNATLQKKFADGEAKEFFAQLATGSKGE